jgi:plastocyanin
MNNKYLTWVAVIAVLAGAYFGWSYYMGGAAPTVTYTDAGYAPGSVTIKAGTAVKFVNNAGGEMHTAFGEHASHDEYPDLIAHESMSVGQSDSITFPLTGSFEYHNHHNEEHVGTVIVE